MRVNTIIDHINSGSIALPEFQRGYVWNRNQVRSFMWSLYKKYPVGSLLVWVTKSKSAKIRGEGIAAPGTIQLLLDGQQRITSLYGIIQGKPPRFFEEDKSIAFTGLYFNLEEESFEFYAPTKMKDNPLWINVSDFFKPNGLEQALQKLLNIPQFKDKQSIYIARLTAINNIKDTELHVDQVTGDDKTVDVVVEIFNLVNSGGTKLSKGDLALAKICVEWPEAREEMKNCLKKWENIGFNFTLELFLRCINSVTTGQAMFSALEDIDGEQFKYNLKKTEKLINSSLNLIISRLGLDHNRVLGSRYSLPLITRYFSQRDGNISDPKERDRLLYWYIHTFLWGRYAGSTESILNQDLNAIENIANGLDNLINNLRQNRGDLTIRPDDFRGWSTGTRFYPILYLLTRIWHSKDFESTLPLSKYFNILELHHIFPKSVLYEAGYKKSEVNALANFTFLTKETNLLISNELPESYLQRYADKESKLVESHWIPMNKELWKVENYREFLDARRALLAKATNDFLNELNSGTITDIEPIQIPKIKRTIPEDELNELNNWIVFRNLPNGEFNFELVDEKTGNSIAIIDLCWPNGIQEGLSKPVAIFLDGDEETEKAVNKAGYLVFNYIGDFKEYVNREVLAENYIVEKL